VDKEIFRQFARFRRRHLWVRGLDLFLEAAFVMTVMAGAMLLLDRLAFELGFSTPHLSQPGRVVAILTGMVALAASFAVAVLLLRPTPPARIAWQLDRAVGGEERFLSALEPGGGPFMAALCRDAVRMARQTEPARVLPRVAVGYRWAIALSLGVGALLWNHPPRLYDGPIADFGAAPLRGPAPLEVFFEDGSIGAINEFLWDFGDGQAGSGENVSHLYEKPGRYVAKLTLRGPGGASEKIGEIDVLPADRAVADFQAAPVKGRGLLEVRFENLSRNAKRHAWEFGDGAISSAAAPIHVYEVPGLYTVRLRVENDIGHDEKTRAKYIKVAHPDEPLADFRALPREGEAPLEVYFEDLSNGKLSEWHWDFGDLRAGVERLSRERNPLHLFRTPGHYTVRLRVKGPHGEDEEEKVRYIHVKDQGGGGLGKGDAPKAPAAKGSDRRQGKLFGEKPDRPRVTPVPEELQHHRPGAGLMEKELTVYSDKSRGGESPAGPVPLEKVLPQFQRAAEDSIERETIPPAYRDHVRRYYEGLRKK
jgi:PKD repeat protein